MAPDYVAPETLYIGVALVALWVHLLRRLFR